MNGSMEIKETEVLKMNDFKQDMRFKNIEPFRERLWLASPTMHGEELQYITEAYESNWMSTVGENIDRIEQFISGYIGVPHAVVLSSGTAALHLAVKLAAERLYQSSTGIRTPYGRGLGGSLYGKRVFCSDLTFGATVNPVVYEGGEPIFIDSEYETWNMDPVALERAFEMYPDVKLVVLVHLYGTPAKVEEIKDICEAHGALLIEDAAESLGAYVKVSGRQQGSGIGLESTARADGKALVAYQREGVCCRQTGSFGDYGVVSFNGNKIITGSSGGMLLVNDAYSAEKAKKWSTQAREAAPWYEHEELGYNYRISNVVAGVVRGQFGHLQEHIEAKKRIYERYREALKELPVFMNPFDKRYSTPNHWLSCMMLESAALCESLRSDSYKLYRHEKKKSCPDEILDALAAFHAEGRPIWKPMHMQPLYRNNAFVGVKQGMLEVSVDIFRRGLCLPSDIKMSEGDQMRVVDIIYRCFA